MRGCVAIPFMVREPRTGLFDRNSSPYPFALSLSKGSEAIATQYLKTGEYSRSIFSLLQGRFFFDTPRCVNCRKWAVSLRFVEKPIEHEIAAGKFDLFWSCVLP